MKIIKVNVKEQWEQNYKKEEFISQIIERILTICKFDENFGIDDKLNEVNNESKNIQEKIKNKEELLLKSNEMKKSLIEKITELEDENLKIKIKLLESLGAEL
jgi:hypothetical protein